MEQDSGSNIKLTPKMRNIKQIIEKCSTTKIIFKEITKNLCESLFGGKQKTFKDIEVKVIFCTSIFCV